MNENTEEIDAAQPNSEAFQHNLAKHVSSADIQGCGAVFLFSFEGTPSGELKKIVQDRFKAGYYKAPKRAGVSYMLVPIRETYLNPDEDDRVVTLNLPHVMYYAPDVSNECTGGKPAPDNPFPFVILPGPHGYMIQLLGQRESAAILSIWSS